MKGTGLARERETDRGEPVTQARARVAESKPVYVRVWSEDIFAAWSCILGKWKFGREVWKKNEFGSAGV